MVLSLAVYPRTYNPSFAIGACVLAIVFASTFALIFPLIAPAVVLLLFLALIGMLITIMRVVAILTHQHSSSISGWICLRSNALTDGRPFTNLAAEAFRNALVFPAYPAWPYLSQPTYLDRRRRSRCCRRCGNHFCGSLHILEGKITRTQVAESDHAKFARGF